LSERRGSGKLYNDIGKLIYGGNHPNGFPVNITL
jgi:hypothetical protein